MKQPMLDLTLAVLTWRLELLVKAARGFVGASYLVAQYANLGIAPNLNQPPQFAQYYQKLMLTEALQDDLHWWQHILCNPLLTFGDNQLTLLWISTWDLSEPQTSSWQELYTVLTTLQQLQLDSKFSQYAASSKILYFTDNTVTYHVCHACRSK